MDTPVKIIVATMILLIVASIILSMFSGQTEPFSDFVTGEREGAQCSIKHSKFVNSLYCGCDRPEDVPDGEPGDCPGAGDDQWPDEQYNKRGDYADECPSYEWSDIGELCGGVAK